jgi:hypothetical protein
MLYVLHLEVFTSVAKSFVLLVYDKVAVGVRFTVFSLFIFSARFGLFERFFIRILGGTGG